MSNSVITLRTLFSSAPAIMRAIASSHVVFLTIWMALSTWSLWSSEPARAQQGQGIMLVTDWPDEETKRTGRFEIFPFIDTLSIAYRYREIERRPDLSIVLEWTPGRDAIYQGRRVAFGEIDGVPAMVGLHLSADVVSGGSRVAEFSLIVDSMVVEASPDLIRIDLPDLGWDNIFVNTPGDVAREIFRAGFDLQNATIVGAGFALFEEGRQIADAAVQKRPAKDGRRPPHVGPRRPRNVSIYRRPGYLDIGFDLFWLIGSGHRRVRSANDGPRENIGRGSLGGAPRSRSGRTGGDVDRGRSGSAGSAENGGGRTARGSDGALAGGRDDVRAGGRDDVRAGDRGDVRAGERENARGGDRDNAHTGGRDDARTGDGEADGERRDREKGEKAREGRSTTKVPSLGKGKSKDDDDDDDDDDKLVPYAIAAVAAAGVLAAVGGTVGYYGNSRYAPFGLTSGIVRNNGGLLVQVGVNEALIAGEGGPKRLIGRVLSFGDLFGSASIQPALGAGVLATSRGSELEYEPSVSVGAVARHNMLLLYGGYDVLQSSPEFSLAIDLRRLGLWSKKRE